MVPYEKISASVEEMDKYVDLLLQSEGYRRGQLQELQSHIDDHHGERQLSEQESFSVHRQWNLLGILEQNRRWH